MENQIIKQEPLSKRTKSEEEEKDVPEENTSVVSILPNNNENPPETKISKRQLKKLRKLSEWESKKKEKRLKEREKCKQKKREAIANGLPTRTGPSPKELKRNRSEHSQNFLKVVVDLDFDDLMIDKDVGKCVKQLLRVYTINRRCPMPAKLIFAGIKEGGRIHSSLKKNDGYQNWDVQWFFKPYTEIIEKDKIVYLTSDSDVVLEKLQEGIHYVIGGLVDHNHHKGLCHERATKLGLKTARLPLTEHVEMKTRTVLSIFHVFEILLRVSEGKSWTETILSVLPMRKGAKSKLDASEESNTSSTIEQIMHQIHESS